LRVIAVLRLPRLCTAKPSGISENGSPPTVAGAAPDLLCRRNDSAHRIPSWLTNAISTPELRGLNEPFWRLSSNPFHFCRRLLRSRNVKNAQRAEGTVAALPSKKPHQTRASQLFYEIQKNAVTFASVVVDNKMQSSRKTWRQHLCFRIGLDQN
jgi:hypothetical protein